MGLITMEGACDLHIHTSPDIFERIADDVRTAEACRDAGMKAIVFKCHADTTMTRAWHTERQVPGIDVYKRQEQVRSKVTALVRETCGAQAEEIVAAILSLSGRSGLPVV